MQNSNLAEPYRHHVNHYLHCNVSKHKNRFDVPACQPAIDLALACRGHAAAFVESRSEESLTLMLQQLLFWEQAQVQAWSGQVGVMSVRQGGLAPVRTAFCTSDAFGAGGLSSANDCYQFNSCESNGCAPKVKWVLGEPGDIPLTFVGERGGGDNNGVWRAGDLGPAALPAFAALGSGISM